MCTSGYTDHSEYAAKTSRPADRKRFQDVKKMHLELPFRIFWGFQGLEHLATRSAGGLMMMTLTHLSIKRESVDHEIGVGMRGSHGDGSL